MMRSFLNCLNMSTLHVQADPSYSDQKKHLILFTACTELKEGESN